VAYQAEIKVGVQGLKRVQDLQSALNKVNIKINAINKVESAKTSTAQKQKLTSVEKNLKIETQASQIQKRALGIKNNILKLDMKGVKISQVKAKLTRAINQAEKGKFINAKRNIAVAEKELQILKEQTVERGRQAKATGKSTFQFPMGKSSPLRFSDQGQLLPGSSRRFDVGSAAISGGFPLLFGQGPLTAAAGALGGGFGGMLGGQMGGFAGGIAATAAVQSIQNAVNAVSQLGQALSPITPNIEALSKSLGLVGTQEQKRLQLIEEVRGKQAAFNAAVDEMRRVIGDEATEKLREFGESTRLIGNEFSIAMTKMQAALAGLFGAVDRFLGLTRGAEKSQRNRAIAGSDNPEVVRRREEIERLENTSGGGRSGAKRRQDRIKILKAELDELGKQEVKINKITTRRENLDLIESSVGKKLQQENELLQAKLDGNFEEVKLAQELDAEIQKRLDKGMGIMEIDIQSIKNAKINNRELTKQVDITEKIKDAYESIAQSIGTDIKDGIAGLIKGTSTLGDMLNNVADKFLDMALNQALFGSILGSGGEKGGGLLGAIGLFANGGRPPVGKPSIVGEKGPELFVPRSSGTIVPNNKLGGGGSTSVVVNVDASGTDVQGDEAQAKELGSLISVAVQGELIKQQRPGGLLASTR